MPQANPPAFDAKRAWKDVLRHVAKELRTTPEKATQRFMPRWWDDSSIQSRGDYLEAILSLASGLQIPAERLDSLLKPLLPENALTRCKGSSPEKQESQFKARQLAEALARNLVAMLVADEVPRRADALELRNRLIARDEIICLDSLLKLCWSLNVPVAHLYDAPSPKPDAVATNVDGRCAIVLLNNRAHCGWHLFDVAHELGHIMLGHLHAGESFYDDGDAGLDERCESEANDFATTLLTGQALSLTYSRTVSAETLLSVVRRASVQYRVDPQWLLVAVGKHWNTDVGWATVRKALQNRWPKDDASAAVATELRRQFRLRETAMSRQDAILSLTTAP